MTTANQRGQALLELAIFGMVAIAALGFLIRVGMQMNYDQEIRMAAFRRALAAAAADNGTNQDALAVTYYYASDRQMPNPTDGLMTLPRTRTEASAFVEWGQRLTFAHQDYERGDETIGQATQQKIKQGERLMAVFDQESDVVVPKIMQLLFVEMLLLGFWTGVDASVVIGHKTKLLKAYEKGELDRLIGQLKSAFDLGALKRLEETIGKWRPELSAIVK